MRCTWGQSLLSSIALLLLLLLIIIILNVITIIIIIIIEFHCVLGSVSTVTSGACAVIERRYLVAVVLASVGVNGQRIANGHTAERQVGDEQLTTATHVPLLKHNLCLTLYSLHLAS